MPHDFRRRDPERGCGILIMTACTVIIAIGAALTIWAFMKMAGA